LKAYTRFSLIGFLFIIFEINAIGQSCPTCVTNKIYESVVLDVDQNPNPGNRWNPIGMPAETNIVLFNRDIDYIWDPTVTTTIQGLVLSDGANLTLDKGNSGNTAAFNIVGGCIVINNGSTLNIKFISELRDATICIEEGGKLIFDARRTDRNSYTFENVLINLQGPDAEIEFGDASIIVEGEVEIIGYFGNGCEDPNGNIISTNAISQDDLCELFRITNLPVEYLYFNPTLNRENRFVKLTWATAKEWENSHFEIERSVNGVNNWEKIGQMEGMGWSDMPVGYEFADEELPLVGGNVYYRLKQVDFDATFAFSKVVSVKVPSLQLTKGVWRVYPNPTNGEKFRIELLNAKEYNGENVQIRLVTPIAGDKTFVGNNINEVSNQLEDFFKRVNKGVYVLEIFWGQKLEYVKVLKD
jgi:hypothetical protein